MSTLLDVYGVVPDGVKNIDLDGDQEYYVDPLRMNRVVDPDFDTEDAKLLIPGFMAGADSMLYDLAKRNQLTALLDVPCEMNETRFGLGRGKPQGTGTSAPMLLQTLLVSHRIAGLNTTQHPESLLMFTARFGPDHYSDLVTNVLTPVLVMFTQRKCRRYGIPMTKGHRMNVYNPATLSWQVMSVELPEYAGLGVLLVPENLLVTEYPYTAQDYVQFEVLEGLKQQYKDAGHPMSKKDILKLKTADIYQDIIKTYALQEAVREPVRYVEYLDKLKTLYG